jgi:hypothetical protein
MFRNRLTYFWLLAVLSMVLSGCAAEAPPVTPAAQVAPTAAPAPVATATLPTAARTAAPAEPNQAAPAAEPSLARGYLTTPSELRRAAVLAGAGEVPYAAAVKAELDYAANALEDWDEQVPKTLKFSDDIEKPKYLSVGAKYAYAWAIAYNLLREDDPNQADLYAEAARDLIMGMPEQGTQVRNYENNTRLNLSVYVHNFVYAADLLADWTPAGEGKPFAESADARKLKEWLGDAIVRFPYNAAHTRINNWGNWARLSMAVVADYVGDSVPMYVQRMVKDANGAYQADPETPCEPGTTDGCVEVDAHTMYAEAIQLHLDAVDGKLYEFTSSSCDASGSKSMIRPDGGIPDELRRQYDCEATQIDDSYGAARPLRPATPSTRSRTASSARRPEPVHSYRL